MGNIWRAVALLLLLAPLAQAASVPLAAELSHAEGTAATGDFLVRASEGALDLSAATGAPRLIWERAEGWLVEKSWDTVSPLGVPVISRNATPSNRTLVFGPGALEGLRPLGGDVVLLGAVGLRSDGTTMLAPVKGPVWFTTGPHEPARPDHFAREVPAGALLVTPHAAPAPFAAGEVTLFMDGAEADLVEGVTREHVRTGTYDEEGDTAATPRVVESFLVLHLHGAAFEAGPAPGARLFALDPAWQIEGDLALVGADGWVRHGSERREVQGAALAFRGAIEGAHGATPALLAPGMRLTLAGEVSSVRVDGRVWEPTLAQRAAPLAAQGALLVAGIAAFSLLPWGAFYSRIRQEEVLLNRNRKRIFDEVASRPGQSIGGLARAVALAEGVVRYHVETLEKRKLVATRLAEGARIVVPVELVALAWGRPTGAAREKIEASMRGAVPLTQAEISARTGLSQRLVSYHLGELQRRGVVRAEGMRPLRYSTTGSGEGSARLSGHAGELGLP